MRMKTNIYRKCNVRHCAKCFTGIFSFNPASNVIKLVPLLSPFYRLAMETQGHTAGIQLQQSAQGLTPFNSTLHLLHPSHGIEFLETCTQKRFKHCGKNQKRPGPVETSRKETASAGGGGMMSHRQFCTEAGDVRM